MDFHNFDSEMSAEKRISRMFTVAKAVAILTVISAHITIRTSSVLANFYSAIGSIGVILFFISAGYYFKKEHPMVMLKKKSKTVVLPWAILGTLVYVINTFLSKGAFGVISYIEWMLGYKTYLYFVIVLLICFILFYYNNIVTQICAVLVTATSLILTNLGILDKVLETLHITNYQNVFNWVGFFALGLLLRRTKPQILFNIIKRTREVALILSAIATILISFLGYKVGYFSPLGWLYEIVSVWSILGLCTYSFMYNKVTVSISETSYAIYLLHMAFVGVLGKIFKIHIIFSIPANLIALAFTWLLILGMAFVAQKIKLGKLYSTCLGLRERRT